MTNWIKTHSNELLDLDKIAVISISHFEREGLPFLVAYPNPNKRFCYPLLHGTREECQELLDRLEKHLVNGDADSNDDIDFGTDYTKALELQAND